MGKNRKGKGGKPKGNQEGDKKESRQEDQTPQVDSAQKPFGESSGVRVFPKQGDSSTVKNTAGEGSPSPQSVETAQSSNVLHPDEKRQGQNVGQQDEFRQQGRNKRNQSRKSEERQETSVKQPQDRQSTGAQFQKNRPEPSGKPYQHDQRQSFEKQKQWQEPRSYDKGYERNQPPQHQKPQTSRGSYDNSARNTQRAGQTNQQQFDGRNQSKRYEPPRESAGAWQNKSAQQIGSEDIPVKSAWNKQAQHVDSTAPTSVWGKQKTKSDDKTLQSMQVTKEITPQQGPSKESGSSKDVAAKTRRSSQSGDYTLENKIVAPGTAGYAIGLLTNHFRISLGKVKVAIQYDVDFVPDRPKKLLKVAFGIFNRIYFPECHVALDGRKQAYSPKELFDGVSKTAKVTVQKDETSSMEFQITITKVKEVNLQAVLDWIENRTNENPRGGIQALEIILGHTLMMNNIKCGSSYYKKPFGRDIVDLGKGMELYRGIFQSINLGHRLYLNVDVANKAFPKEQNVIDLILELCYKVDLKKPMDYRNLRDLEAYIKNLKIQSFLDNKPNAKREYVVNGLHTPASTTQFTYENQTITVEEYFKKIHSITLQFPHMPCLWVGPKNKSIYLPPECCKILPEQAVRSKLDKFQTTKMIRTCCVKPHDRKKNITKCLENARHNADPVIGEFDLRVSRDFEKVNGRVLDPPQLTYKTGNSDVKDGVWKAMKFLVPANVESWTIVCLDQYVETEQMNNLAKQLVIRGRLLGMTIGQPLMPLKKIRWNEIDNALEKLKNLTIVFVIIGDGIYDRVKKVAELQVGCLTQCIMARTVGERLNASTVDNILLKVNMKCNGMNHVLSTVPAVMKEPVMIMGADVTHPSPFSSEPSVAAVTASHDLQAIKYNTQFGIQKPGLEYIQNLEKISRDHLNYFKKETGKLPQRIIFYRDGVAMGQFAVVLQTEYQDILNACNKISPDYKPLITFIVVQKRHHTRFFPEDPRDGDKKNGNVPAGTCVDTAIVLPRYQNFYLISHASLQGTARPTKYVVLKDDNNFTNDDLQMLTYYLCHMFVRCTRSVSYPAATYYAHLAALRGKAYINFNNFDINNIEREQQKLKIKQRFVDEIPMFFV